MVRLARLGVTMACQVGLLLVGRGAITPRHMGVRVGRAKDVHPTGEVGVDVEELGVTREAGDGVNVHGGSLRFQYIANKMPMTAPPRWADAAMFVLGSRNTRYCIRII